MIIIIRDPFGGFLCNNRIICMKRKMCLFFSKSHWSDQDFTFVFLLLLKELQPNLIIPGSCSCKCTCLLRLLCNKGINRGLLRPWATICRCRVAKNLSHSPCRLPAEGKALLLASALMLETCVLFAVCLVSHFSHCGASCQ